MTQCLSSIREERKTMYYAISLSLSVDDFHTTQMTCSLEKLNQSRHWPLIGPLASHCIPIGALVFITHSLLKAQS